MAYQLLFKPSARKSLLKIPQPFQGRLVAAAESLAVQPRPSGVKKLQGDENLWRIRVGNYRIVYEIHDGELIVLVIRIADRKDAYS